MLSREEKNRMNALGTALIARADHVGEAVSLAIYDEGKNPLRIKIVRDREESEPLGSAVWDRCYVIRPGSSPDYWESVGNRYGLMRAIEEYYDAD